jgi:phosphonopyruvate decarboxylase
VINPSALAQVVSSSICSGVFGVPDSLLAEFSSELENFGEGLPRVTACNEGSAIGMAIGSFLATSLPALVYMQNSGLGNAVNPILALADRSVYGVPLVMLIGWRGQPGTTDEPQHLKQGEITEELLTLLDVPFFTLPKNDLASKKLMHDAFRLAVEREGPVAILVERGSFITGNLSKVDDTVAPLSFLTREEAMKIVHGLVRVDDKVVVTTGMLGREVEEFQNSMLPKNRPGTFLVVGGMGHASSIALGISLAKPAIRVWCFDGDGAMLMHLGAVPVIANSLPKDFMHVVFDNGAHDSVGGQKTFLMKSDLAKIACAAGYMDSLVACSESEILDKLSILLKQSGPRLLVIKVKTGSRPNLGRPKEAPRAAKVTLMNGF